MAEGGQGNEGESSKIKRELFPEQGTSVDRKGNELSLLIKITKENGESLPYGVVNDQLIIELFQNAIGTLPHSILVLNDQDVLLDFMPGTSIFEMAQAVHGKSRYRDTVINVGCLMSTREFLIITEKEREEIRIQRDDLEREREELEARELDSKEVIKVETEAAEVQYQEYRTEMNELN